MAFPLSLVKLTFRGIDAREFLQGYVTSDLQFIEPFQAAPTAFTDRMGRVICNGWIAGTPEEVAVVIACDVEKTLRSHLQPYLSFAKCVLDQSSEPVQVTSSDDDSGWILGGLATKVSTAENSVTLLEPILVQKGFPLVSNQTSSKFLPQALNLDTLGAVSFDKGCYLGQEVVSRAQFRGKVKKHLRKLTVEEDTPTIGTAIAIDDVRGVIINSDGRDVLAVIN